MRPLLVVRDEPAFGQGADLRQRFEEIRIKHLGAIATVEALDKGVLIWLARLDVVDAIRRSSPQSTKVCAVSSGLLSMRRAAGRPCSAMSSSKTRDHPPSRDRPPHVDGQAFTIPFVDDGERSKAASVRKDVSHEIERPGLVQHRWNHERVPHPVWDAAFRPAGQIEPYGAVHAMHPFVIPRVALQPPAAVTLPEAPAPMLGHNGHEGGNHRRIARARQGGSEHRRTTLASISTRRGRMSCRRGGVKSRQ